MPTPLVTPTPAPTSAFLTFGNGVFIVGTEIQPGTYRTRVPSPGCYWDRLSAFGGTLDNIIANGGSDGPELVTISASDKGFRSSGCGTWTSDLSAVVSPGSPLPAGAYIVGTDVMAGTYRSAASAGCYWERLRDFGGRFAAVITSGLTDRGATVTISASDMGFRSDSCAPWTKLT
jgi:hypothetical protein